MHMTDGLLSPEVGVAMWAVTAGATAYGIKKITDSDLSEKKTTGYGCVRRVCFCNPDD